MAALSEANAVIRVLDAVGRVSGDAQLPSATIIRKLDDVYRRLRRRLAVEFPGLYETFRIATITGNTIPKPDGTELIRVIERQYNDGYYPIQAANSLNRSLSAELSFFESGSNLIVKPDSLAPGTYRIWYVAAPPTTVTTYDVPNGLEGIIIEETAAWARQRHNEFEQVQYHLAEAKRIWDDAYMGLWQRYGAHGRSVMNEVYY